VVGAIVIVVLMVLVIPALIFVGGAIWSALVGTLMVHDAEDRYEGREELDRELW
jgi:hypothetical protein